MYKIVACDVDGTLVNSDGVISAENKKAIQKIHSLGVNFVIATGRNDILVRELIDDLGTGGTVLGCNGSSVRDILSGELYVLEAIGEEPLKAMIRDFTERDILFNMFSLDTCFSPKDCYQRIFDLQKNYFKIKPNLMKQVIIDDPLEIFLQDQPIIKVCTFSENAGDCLALQESIRKIPGVDAVRPTSLVIDVMKDGVSKGSAVAQFAEKLGIAREDVIAIGDGENDISMLDYAGCAVAMANAAEAVFEHADLKTDSNVNDGVAKALTKLFSL